MSNPRNVLTIATGKKIYLDMAVNLARSFMWWHPDSDISFYLATDMPLNVPEDVTPKVNIIKLSPGEYGLGFSTKLNLDKLAPAGQTLFIDSDCLIYADLTPVFEKFKGHAVSVTGNYISTGEWFGDVATICQKFNVPHLPKFNGGVYYLENSPLTTQVYETARRLEEQYDDIGFVRLRGRPNDEVLMALAMQLHSQITITDDGSVLAEFVNFQSGIKSDLLNGVIELYNKPGHTNYQPNWHLTLARPAIVHFLGHHSETMPYLKEIRLLQYVFLEKLAISSARFLTFFKVTLPANSIATLKDTFRKAYHTLFGVRAVKTSERIIP